MFVRFLVIGIAILVIIFGMYSVTVPGASAHQSGCHRWHSCPSDIASYTCGDLGYCSECQDNSYCKAGQSVSFSSSSPPSNSETSLSSNSLQTTQTVPEFPIAFIVLIVATFSIILIPKLRF